MALSPYQQLLTSALGLPSTPMTTGIRPMSAPPTPAMSTGVPEDPMRRRLAALKAEYAGGDVDPRMTALLDRRMQRITEQETEAKEERRRTPWEALMRAGTAMASSQSPFFSQALSAGISEGMGTLQQRRLEAIKQRTGFGDARDAVEMERIKNEIDVRKTATQNMRDDMGLMKDLSAQDKANVDAAIAEITLKNAPDKAAAEIAKLIADVNSSGVTDALNNARIGTERAQAGKYRAEGLAAGQKGGISENSVEARADRTELDRAVALYDAARVPYLALLAESEGDEKKITDTAVITEMKAKLAMAVRFSKAYKDRYKHTPYEFGGLVSGRAAAAGTSTAGWSATQL